MAEIDFFQNTDQLRSFAKGIPASHALKLLVPDSRPAIRKILNLLGADTYNQLKAYGNQSAPDPVDNVLAAGCDFVRVALANMISASYFIFEAQERNNTDKNLYRYQENKILEEYLERTWEGLDSLVEHLDANTEKYTDWANSDTYKQRENLFIKTAPAFDKYFGIKSSGYFFTNIIYLMREVQESQFSGRFNDFPTDVPDNDKLKWAIGKAIAFETMAIAIRRFDYTELPVGIRNDLYKEANTSRGTEFQAKEKLSALYYQEAEKYFKRVDAVAYEATQTTDTITEQESPNDEDNKFYLMS